jgi:hypothetical protein
MLSLPIRWAALALFTLPWVCGCDLLTRIAREESRDAEEDEWGPFRFGMPLAEVKAIIKAQTGDDPQVERLPGLPWETIFFQDKMLAIQHGQLLCVLKSQRDAPSFDVPEDTEPEDEGDDECDADDE